MASPDSVMAGLDWLTCTTQNERIGMAWYRVYLKHKKAEEFTGLDVKEWRNRWYAGETCTGAAWGQSDRLGYIFIAKGWAAQKLWREFAPSRGKVTRVDAQVTVDITSNPRDLASEAYERVKDLRGRNYSRIQNTLGGQTVYVGSRNSDQYGRLYDKGIKAGTHFAGELWRYEVEVKKPRADVFMSDMFAAEMEDGVDLLRICTYVYNWFASRGIDPIFKPSNEPPVIADVGKRVATADKKIAWLKTQVRPTVQALISYGLGKDCVEALGFDARQLSFLSEAVDK